MKQTIVIGEEDDGQRLDVVLAQHRPQHSRASAARTIKAGEVSIDGAVAVLSKQRLKSGQTIDIVSPSLQSVTPAILERVYEDDSCVVINKPTGLLVHSRSNHNDEATVASSFRDQTSDTDPLRGGIVHRLDRDTSGLLLLAKSIKAKDYYQAQFKERLVEKVYCAIVQGEVSDKEAIFKWPIQRNPKKPHIFRVAVNGKSAETKMQKLSSNRSFSKLILRPKTGRTHQLRVHLAHYGHPIVGDALYSTMTAERLYLHAQKIRFVNTGHQVVEVEAPPEWNEAQFGFNETIDTEK